MPTTHMTPPYSEPPSGQLNTFVKVKHRVPGFHRWPLAPRHRDYLATRHPHLFVIELTIEVTGPDRVIEFHDLRDWLASTIETHYGGLHHIDPCEFGDKSCEMIAHWIVAQVLGHHGYDFPGIIQVHVSEDGEYTGIVTYSPPLEPTATVEHIA